MCYVGLIRRQFLFWCFKYFKYNIRIQLRLWRAVNYYVTVFPKLNVVLCNFCNFALECLQTCLPNISISYYYYYYYYCYYCCHHNHCHNNIYEHKKLIVFNTAWVWFIHIWKLKWPLNLEISISLWKYLDKYGGRKGGYGTWRKLKFKKVFCNFGVLLSDNVID
jgi:hypothetical protein